MYRINRMGLKNYTSCLVFSLFLLSQCAAHVSSSRRGEDFGFKPLVIDVKGIFGSGTLFRQSGQNGNPSMGLGALSNSTMRMTLPNSSLVLRKLSSVQGPNHTLAM